MTPQQMARWLYNYLNFPEYRTADRTYDVPDRLLPRYLNLVATLVIDDTDKTELEKRELKEHV